MKKHKILFLLAFAIFVIIMAFSVSASTEKDGIYYDLNDNTMEATVSADNRTNCTLEKVVIPSTVEINGKTYTVTKFAASAFGALNNGNKTLKEITIPYTVTTLPERAFQSCTNLESVTIENTKEHPSQLTYIGVNAFWECKALKSFFVPKSVKDIDSNTGGGSGTFRSCTSLESVIFEEGSNLEIIKSGLFYNCTKLTSIVIPDNVNTIQGDAFYNCTTLESVTFPKNLTTIGNSAFNSCKALGSITLPQTVTSIGTSAFYNTSIKTVLLPRDLQSIGSNAFSTVETVTIHTILNTVSDNAFGAPLKTIIYSGSDADYQINIIANPNVADGRLNNFSYYGITLIYGAYVCEYGLHEWDNFTYDKSGEREATCTDDGFGTGTCKNCGVKEQVELPALGHSFGDSVNMIPPTCTEDGKIQDFCKRCHLEVDETIPAIGHNYAYTYILPTLTKNGKIIGVCRNEFDGIPCGHQEEEIIPAGYCGIWKMDLDNNYIYDADYNMTLEFISPDEALIITGTSVKLNGVYKDKIYSVIIPDGIERLADSAFKETSVVYVIVSDSVKVFETNAFRNCKSLKTVEISKNSQLESFGYYVFMNSTIESFYFPKTFKSMAPENKNDGGPFHTCQSLVSVTFDPEITELTVLPNFAFHECRSLEVVMLPDCITAIGERAFQFCSSLKKLYLGNSLVEFTGISVIYLNGAANALQYVFMPKTFTGAKGYVFNNGSNTVFFFNGTKAEALLMVELFRAAGNNGQLTNIPEARYFEFDPNANYEEIRQGGSCVVYNANICESMFGGEHKFGENHDCTKGDTCLRCGKTTAPSHENHDLDITIVYPEGFDKEGRKTVTCKHDGCTAMNGTYVADALIIAKGYSVSDKGDAIIGGYAINLVALKEYEAVYGKITYGILFVNVNDESVTSLEFVDGVIQIVGAVKAIQVEAVDDERGYSSFNYRVTGFDPKQSKYSELKIVLSAYVISNDEISFIQSKSMQNNQSVEYEKEVKIKVDGKDSGKTLGAITLGGLFQKSEYKDQYNDVFGKTTEE